MDTINIHAAKTHFSGLVERVEKGETIIIARAGKPVARLVPPEPETTAMPARRAIGFSEGEYDIAADFDARATGHREIEDQPKPRATHRLGFLKGQMGIPDDFNEMGREDIERLFNGDP
ncbi:hypothetical protein BZG35_08170 [Brevundimonas sp. LM2]|uniref:type II toxin-antitoxin system Phd/YefM family antitoxin n=1 Tax=Brevundimonas sp. LM2 TaxID=1938605 RepID=UPI000983AFB6|nr:type II toxin-antitoxin system Phd/YefM family antitoxin [Brevundimonas sp. LM2]AQR61627.1 hypothetical protein BZG35_08170 [Brevundimonas sp. LM2]